MVMMVMVTMVMMVMMVVMVMMVMMVMMLSTVLLVLLLPMTTMTKLWGGICVRTMVTFTKLLYKQFSSVSELSGELSSVSEPSTWVSPVFIICVNKFIAQDGDVQGAECHLS